MWIETLLIKFDQSFIMLKEHTLDDNLASVAPQTQVCTDLWDTQYFGVSLRGPVEKRVNFCVNNPLRIANFSILHVGQSKFYRTKLEEQERKMDQAPELEEQERNVDQEPELEDQESRIDEEHDSKMEILEDQSKMEILEDQSKMEILEDRIEYCVKEIAACRFQFNLTTDVTEEHGIPKRVVLCGEWNNYEGDEMVYHILKKMYVADVLDTELHMYGDEAQEWKAYIKLELRTGIYLSVTEECKILDITDENECGKIKPSCSSHFCIFIKFLLHSCCH